MSAIGLAAILWLTLRPNAAYRLVSAAACCSPLDIIFNILLFVPLGAGFALLGLRPRSAVVAGALLSIGVELSQHWWVEGRFASLTDVASNTAGCALGVLVVAHWERRARWWPRVAPVLAVVVVLGWFLGGYLAQPAIPGPAPWTSEWAHPRADMSPFTGELLDPRLQGVPLPEGPIGNLAALRARLSASHKVEFAATVVAGTAPQGRSRIFEIVVGEGTVPFLILDQLGGTLLAYQRLGLSWVGLPGPWLALKQALPLAAGDTIQVRLEATRRHLRLVAIRGGVERETSIRLAPELYFGSLSYRATDGAIWWNLVSAVASFILLGMALANRPRLLVVAGLAALFLSAYGGGCAFPAWPVALLAVVGAAAGRMIATRQRMFGG